MICGGSSTMLVEYVRDCGPYRAALDAVEMGRRVIMVKRMMALTAPEVAVNVTAVEESDLAQQDAGADPRSGTPGWIARWRVAAWRAVRSRFSRTTASCTIPYCRRRSS